MRTFQDLTESERVGLMEALEGHGGVAPLFVYPTPLPDWHALTKWTAVGGLALLAWQATRGFGEVGHPQALQGWAAWTVYLLGVSAVVAWLALPVHRRLMRRFSKLPAGTWVFPTGFVRVAEGGIEVHRFRTPPTVTLEQARGGVRVRVEDATERLELLVPRTSDRLRELAFLASGLRAARLAFEARDREWLLSQDPLAGGEGDLLVDPPSPAPALLARGWPLAIGVTVLVSMLLHTARNESSDREIVSALRESEDVAGLRWYAASAGDRAEEADQVWLPALARERFDKGVELASSQYWAAYLDEFPDGSVEVWTTHLPDALLGEALDEGTVSALRAFIAAHPGPGHEARRQRAEEAIGRIYEEAGSAFTEQSSGSARLNKTMVAVLSWLHAQAAPDLPVVFRVDPPRSVSGADRLLQGRYQTVDCTSYTPAGPYLESESWREAEDTIVDLLQEGFRQVAPEDVMALRATPVEALEPDHPRIEVRYGVRGDWTSGSPVVYVERTTSGCYLGLSVQFDVRVVPPDGGRSFNMKVRSRPPEEFAEGAHRRFMRPSGSVAYDTMLALAFENLTAGLRTQLFAEDSEASRRIRNELLGETPPAPR